MTHRLRRIAGVLAASAALLCAGSAAAQIELEVWHSLSQDFGAPEFEAFAEEFNAVQDEIVVNVIYTGGYTDTLRRAEAALASGNPPAISMFEQTRGAGFVDAEAILPLDDLIANDPDTDRSDFFERLLTTCAIDGQLWCIPYNTSTPLIYYNADMFRDAGLDPETDVPTTWDELMEVGPAFAQHDDGGSLTRWAFGMRSDPGWMFDAWLGQAGGSFLNDDGDAFVFNDDRALEMAEFWLRMIDEEVAVPMGTSQTYDEFFAGNQAMVFQSTALLVSYLAQADFDIGVAPLWCHAECYAPLGGANLYIFDVGDDEVHQAAWEFLDFVTSVEKGAEFSVATGYHAPREASLDTDLLQARFAEVPEARVTYDQMALYGSARTLVPFWGEVHSLLTVATEQILLEGVDPQTALDEAVDEANRLLDVFSF